MVDTLNSIINKSSAATKSFLDIFSPLRSSLTRTDSLTQITEEITEIEGAKEEEEEFENKTTQEFEETIDVVQYYEETTTVTVEEAVEDIFNPYRFIKSLPPPPDSTLEFPPVLPPKDPNDKRLTLVLDLDETLVHCSTEAFGIGDADYTFDVTSGGTDYHVFARKRPFLEDFFSKIAGKFEVIIFTASQQVYANKLLDLLGAGEHVHHRLFRDSCVLVEGNYLKDLRVLGRDLSRVVIVDNSPLTYGFQIDNGIPIESWYDDESDMELLKLCPFLEKIRDVEDVRPLVRSKFKTYQLVASA
jgi:CTD small phosphatase-like protein 2